MARPTKKEQTARKISKAVSKLTPEAVQKLEQVFALDASLKEICFYLDISERTFYNWKERNVELFQRLEALREKPVLKARGTIISSLDDPKNSQWYLEHKKKAEFGVKPADVNVNVNIAQILDTLEGNGLPALKSADPAIIEQEEFEDAIHEQHQG